MSDQAINQHKGQRVVLPLPDALQEIDKRSVLLDGDRRRPYATFNTQGGM
jgi:hypothetical protein